MFILRKLFVIAFYLLAYPAELIHYFALFPKRSRLLQLLLQGRLIGQQYFLFLLNFGIFLGDVFGGYNAFVDGAGRFYLLQKAA